MLVYLISKIKKKIKKKIFNDAKKNIESQINIDIKHRKSLQINDINMFSNKNTKKNKQKEIKHKCWRK